MSDEGKEKVEQSSAETSQTQDSEEITPAKETIKATPAETKTYASILRANPLYPEAEKIVHWRDPIKSGLLFGIFNFFYFLITFGEYSFLTLVSYLLLALLSVCFGYVNYVVLRASWFQGKRVDNPLKERFRNANFHVSKNTAEQHLQTVVDLINTTIDKCRDAFYVSNNIATLKVAAYLYAFAVLGKWFNDSTLLYLAVLGLFIWPRLYEEKQKEIDQVYALAVAEISKYYQLALSKVPPHIQQRLAFLKEKAQ